jgi:hypothetical protein
MHKDENNPGGFKVTDKRRFTDSGDLKPSDTTTNTNQQTKSQSASTWSQAPDINFSTFVISMATQASMQMGLIAPPPGVPLSIDLASAKQTIDILGMLEEKTKGNLNDEERRLLANVLHELRLGFVQCS